MGFVNFIWHGFYSDEPDTKKLRKEVVYFVMVYT